jgi:hypothetical protein
MGHQAWNIWHESEIIVGSSGLTQKWCLSTIGSGKVRNAHPTGKVCASRTVVKTIAHSPFPIPHSPFPNIFKNINVEFEKLHLDSSPFFPVV